MQTCFDFLEEPRAVSGKGAWVLETNQDSDSVDIDLDAAVQIIHIVSIGLSMVSARTHGRTALRASWRSRTFNRNVCTLVSINIYLVRMQRSLFWNINLLDPINVLVSWVFR